MKKPQNARPRCVSFSVDASTNRHPSVARAKKLFTELHFLSVYLDTLDGVSHE